MRAEIPRPLSDLVLVVRDCASGFRNCKAEYGQILAIFMRSWTAHRQGHPAGL